MDWTKDFYTKQVLWGEWPARWTAQSLRNLPPGVKTHLAAVERLAGAGPKRILELGAGAGYTAAALADHGHSVVAVEIVEESITNLRRLATEVRGGDLSVIAGDFYAIALPAQFDMVCYFDGFGIGSDAEQRRLLQRIAGWLTPTGCALIDVLTPWHWAQVGRQP